MPGGIHSRAKRGRILKAYWQGLKQRLVAAVPCWLRGTSQNLMRALRLVGARSRRF